MKEYNALAYEQKEEKYNILKQLFGGIGANVTVGSPFICDYGRNIYIGDHVSVNMNCTFVDCNGITNVQLYTATHPVEFAERYIPDQDSQLEKFQTYALPVGNPCRVLRKINGNK